LGPLLQLQFLLSNIPDARDYVQIYKVSQMFALSDSAAYPVPGLEDGDFAAVLEQDICAS